MSQQLRNASSSLPLDCQVQRQTIDRLQASAALLGEILDVRTARRSPLPARPGLLARLAAMVFPARVDPAFVLYENTANEQENTTVREMLDVTVMRKDGQRLDSKALADQRIWSGDFVLDTANGARRLRLKSPWDANYAPIELYEPVLVSASAGRQIWRGFERVGERGVVQEWMVRSRG